MDNLDPTLAEYALIIEQLKPLIKLADFNDQFNLITADLPKPKRFLIKMELTRLATPCTRKIDLRGHVDGICEPFSHNGVLHYMDDVAINRFNKGLDIYGLYTTGVFEDVHNADNNFRVIHKKEQAKRLQKSSDTSLSRDEQSPTITQYPTQAISFGSRGIRKEERMIYAISVKIELNITEPQLINAVTTDLSVSGCRLKVSKKQEMTIGQTIYLQFIGLEKEFELGLKDKIQYKIVGIDQKGEFIYPRCSRLYDVSTQKFDEFLSNLINGNKRRYKLNLDNTIDAVITKGYEQYYLPRINSLPIFINENTNDKQETTLTPFMTLLNDNNNIINKQWSDELNNNCLSQLLTQNRLQALLTKSGRIKETIYFAFTHVTKGKIFFYSASIDELNQNPKIKSLFLGFGSTKNNWMVYKAQLIDIEPSLAHLALTLPDTSTLEADKINKPPSARVVKHLQNLKYLVVLTDITDETSQQQYQQYPFKLEDVNKLHIFGHNKKDQILPIEEVAIKYVNLRAETRFSYKTQVVMLIDSIEREGLTKDFSVKGMQIELSEPLNVPVYTKVKMTLPQLQTISPKIKLKNLEYEIVGFNKSKTLINLRIFEQKGAEHKGKVFFEQLIDNNNDKLKPTNIDLVIPGLAEALRNIFVQRILNTGFFIHKYGIKHELNTIGFSSLPNAVADLFNSDVSETGYNLYPILCNNYLNSVFINMLRRLQRDSRPLYQDFYIKVKLDETDVIKRYTTCLTNSMRNDAAKKIFIQHSTQNKTLFFALRVYLSRTGRPDTEFISKELNYVSRYAIHKAKILEEELWSVAGVGDIIDITEEVLNRFNFPTHIISEQMRLRQPNH